MTELAALTAEQAEIVSAFTGVLMMPVGEFHRRIELKLGRPVWTHEFANKDLWAEIKEIYRNPFLRICASEVGQ